MEEADWAFLLHNNLRNFNSKYPERPGRQHPCRSGTGRACRFLKYPPGHLRSSSHLLAPPAHTTCILFCVPKLNNGGYHFLTAVPHTTLGVIWDSSLLYPASSHCKFFGLYLQDLVWPQLTPSASVFLAWVTLTGLLVPLSRAARGAFKMKGSSHYSQLPFLTSIFISLLAYWHRY